MGVAAVPPMCLRGRIGQSRMVRVSPHPMSPNSAVVASRRPVLRASTRALRFLVGGLAAVWSLLLLAWLTLHWGILPHIDDWRPRIEDAASRALGVPVRIGSIQVRSGGWIPAAELHEVVLLDQEGREALRLPRVSAALSVPALLAFELRFEQLLIEGARLEMRRDARGRIHVAGLEVGQAGAGEDHAAADWFFRQHEFVIRGGSLTWIDELRRSPALELTDAVVVVRNGLLHHDLRVDATPQSAWGERFSLRARLSQPLMARAGEWRLWRGTVHADLPHVDVALLRQYVDMPFELREGRGALRAWLEVADGRADGATVDLALRNVALRLSAQVAPMEFESLRVRLDGEQGDRRARVAARRLTFTTADGVLWPESEIEASWRVAPAGSAPGDAAPEIVSGEFSADRLDVALLASLASRVPLSEGVRKMLVELAPRGTVHALVARWDGPIDAPRQYQVRARMKGLSIAAAPAVDGVGRPGWLNADIELQASELGGDARLTLAEGALEFPGVFDRPVVPLRRFDAKLVWRIGAARPNGRPIELQVKEARFDNDDASGDLALRWRTGDGAGFGRAGRFPGMLDLQGKLTGGQATSVARYLPRGLPGPVREYVQHAVQAGKVPSATFKVKGDLWDFPYFGTKNPQDGEFRIVGQFADLTLAYVPSHPGGGAGEPAWISPWPAITRADGELVVERSSLSIRNAQGRIYGVELRGVQGGVHDFAHQATLELEGQARGPLADMLRYVNATPVGEWIGGALAQATAQGAADLRLALSLPLAQMPQSTAKGSLQLSGNDIRLRPDTPLLAAARGRVDFSQRGLQIVGGAVRALGGEATVDGGTQPDGDLRFNVQGTATAEGLRRTAELGPPARLGQVLQGQAPYRLQLGFVKGLTELNLTSPMTGIAINLPPPLNKPAEQSLPLRVQSVLQADSLAGGSTPRDQLRIELGPLLQAVYQRELSGDGPRVLRSAIGINAPAPAPVAGGQVQAEFASLNVDAWRAALAKLLPPASGSVADAGYVPRSISLRAQEAVAGARRLTHLFVDLVRLTRDDNEIWRAQLTADQMAGLIEYREARTAQGAGRLYARLSRLSLPPAEVEGFEQLLDQAPASVPGLDIVVDDFELRGKHLGRLEVEAVNRGVATGDVAREWRLNRLALRTPEANLSASGQWAAAGGAARRRMALDFELELADSGAYLDRLGYGKTLRGGKGVLKGQLAWSGSPLGWDTKSLDGSMNLSLDAGQFLKADAGAGRLLGVLSLQALPRRLLLDFRDVFQEGFAFDNIGGDFRINAGVLHTNNLRMRGVQAAVLMEGQADIGLETQDLRVFVVPEINAGTASLAYAAINPALGLGTFIAQWLLRRPLIAANTRELRITGKWDDPKIERVERQPGDAVPSIDGPAAAASAPPQRP